MNSLRLTIALAFCLAGLTSFAQSPNLEGPYMAGAATLQGPTWITVAQSNANGQMTYSNQPNGMGATNYSNVQMASTNPPSVYNGYRPQPTPVTSGVCAPCIQGVDCADHCGTEPRWSDAKRMDFQPLMHGEFIGPIRMPAMLQYRVRLGDELQFIYVLSRQKIDPEYRLQVGDELQISSVTITELKVGDNTKGISIQPDGKLTLPLIGYVQTVGLTIPQLRIELEKKYKQYYKNPGIDVLPVKTNTRLGDLQNSVDNRAGTGGQAQTRVVNPDGRINLQMIGSVYVYGMTLDDIRREVNLRYADRVTGIEIEPLLGKQAPHFVYVFGEVGKPGRIEITSPTTVTMALAMVEGVKNGGNHRQVIVMRRADDWRLVATKLDLRGQHLGRRPAPSDDIWLRDSDLIIVPPTPVKVMDNLLEQVFTSGIYRVVPFGGISIQQQQ